MVFKTMTIDLAKKNLSIKNKFGMITIKKSHGG